MCIDNACEYEILHFLVNPQKYYQTLVPAKSVIFKGHACTRTYRFMRVHVHVHDIYHVSCTCTSHVTCSPSSNQLLGLDGSFRFLEHVLWLVCLVLAIIVSFGESYLLGVELEWSVEF